MRRSLPRWRSGESGVPANPGGWVKTWPNRVWAVEGANGAGRPLAQRLVESGEQVVDVPAKLAARSGCSTPATTARPTRWMPTRSPSSRSAPRGYGYTPRRAGLSSGPDRQPAPTPAQRTVPRPAQEGPFLRCRRFLLQTAPSQATTTEGAGPADPAASGPCPGRPTMRPTSGTASRTQADRRRSPQWDRHNPDEGTPSHRLPADHVHNHVERTFSHRQDRAP